MQAVQTRSSSFAGQALRQGQRAARTQAVRGVRVAAAADRPVWFPGNPPPKHLDGTLPGDFGFDPLNLGSDPELLKWFVSAELTHARVAMMGAAGMLFPSILHAAGSDIPEWFDAGKVAIESSAIPLPALIFVQVLLTQWVELKRLEDFKNPGSQADGSFFGITDDFKGTGNGYPGGKYFDFLGFSRGDPKDLETMKWREIRNGRLAMVAVLGMFAQYFATGVGPIENLSAHLASPFTTTFATNGVSLPFLQ